MHKIIQKQVLNTAVTLMEIGATLIAEKAEPGQFGILQLKEKEEKIPLTIADFNREKGTVTIIFPLVPITKELAKLEIGESIYAFEGPFGNPFVTQENKKVAVVGGGVGCAIAYSLAKKLHEQGTTVHVIAGFKNKAAVILEEAFEKVSDKLFITTADGSYQVEGFVTDVLGTLLEDGEQYDQVIAIGPLMMMRFVSLLTKPYHIKTIVSMNPLMMDGAGTCGGFRLKEAGKVKLACMDGPHFDGHLVDFEEILQRSMMYEKVQCK